MHHGYCVLLIANSVFSIGTKKCHSKSICIYLFQPSYTINKFNVNSGDIVVRIKTDAFNSSQQSIHWSILKININNQHNPSTCFNFQNKCKSTSFTLVALQNFIYFLMWNVLCRLTNGIITAIIWERLLTDCSFFIMALCIQIFPKNVQCLMRILILIRLFNSWLKNIHTYEVWYLLCEHCLEIQ